MPDKLLTEMKKEELLKKEKNLKVIIFCCIGYGILRLATAIWYSSGEKNFNYFTVFTVFVCIMALISWQKLAKVKKEIRSRNNHQKTNNY